MIPLLDFAKRLSLYHHVTYVASASKIDTLKQRGFLDENENEKSGSTQSMLEIIGLFDGNDDDYEVSLIAQWIELVLFYRGKAMFWSSN